jgi:hypothetical protein
MRLIVITIAAALSLALHGAAVAQSNVLAITETGETLNVTFNGAPTAGAIITGPANAWTVQFVGFTLNSSLVGTSYFFVEPDNPALFNQISITQPTFLLFSSEVPAGQTFGTSEPNPFTIPNASGPTGPTFDLTFADRIGSVPDNGATVMFLGIALGGICLFRRFARLAA